MLNVKKLSMIKAILFGLALWNTGIDVQAAGAEVDPAAGAAAPVSLFLNAIEIPDAFADQAAARVVYGNLIHSMRPGKMAGAFLIHHDRGAQAGEDAATLQMYLDKAAEKFAQMPHLNERDKTAFKILALKDGPVDDDVRAALRALDPAAAMPDPEFNLRILLYTMIRIEPDAEAAFDYIEKFDALRAALAAYKAPVMDGPDDVDMEPAAGAGASH